MRRQSEMDSREREEEMERIRILEEREMQAKNLKKLEEASEELAKARLALKIRKLQKRLELAKMIDQVYVEAMGEDMDSSSDDEEDGIDEKTHHTSTTAPLSVGGSGGDVFAEVNRGGYSGARSTASDSQTIITDKRARSKDHRRRKGEGSKSKSPRRKVST